MNQHPRHTTFNRPCLAGMVCGSLLLLSAHAHANNGSQLGGYGIKNAGMGGASIAMGLDASAAANNPAGMAFVPISMAGNYLAFQGQSTIRFAGRQLEDKTTMVAPEFGLNWALSPNMTLGLSFSGAGAGVDFGEPLLPVPGAENLQTSQKTAETIPSITWKIAPELAVGFAISFAAQRVDTQGVLAQVAPGVLVPVPGHGSQTAYGVGARIGVLWHATPQLAVGATYKTRTEMSQLKGYADDTLAYSEGHLDIPAEYGIGLAWKASPAITVAADWLQIEYAAIKVYQDPNGARWQNQPVVRLGVSWDVLPSVTLRGGVSRNRLQIDSDRVAQNFLSPAIGDTSYTAGATLKLNANSDVSFSFEISPSRTLDGTGTSTGASITSQTKTLRLGYQWTF